MDGFSEPPGGRANQLPEVQGGIDDGRTMCSQRVHSRSISAPLVSEDKLTTPCVFDELCPAGIPSRLRPGSAGLDRIGQLRTSEQVDTEAVVLEPGTGPDRRLADGRLAG